MTRDDAWSLLTEFTKGDSLRKHAADVVAGALRAAALDALRRREGEA